MPQPQWQQLTFEGIRWRKAKQPQRAIECITQSIEITRQSPDLARETATSLNYLSDVYLQEGLLALAEDTIRQAIQTRLSLAPEERSLVANDLSILGEVLSKQGRHREALEAGSQGLELFQQDYGTGDSFVRQIEEMVEQLRQNLIREETIQPSQSLS